MMVRETPVTTGNDSGYLSASPTSDVQQQAYYNTATGCYDASGYEQYGAMAVYGETHLPQGGENVPPVHMNGMDTGHVIEGYVPSEGWHTVAGHPYAYPQHSHPSYLGMTGYDMLNTPSAQQVVLGPNGKPKRRRVPTPSQRRAANIRERRRMFNLNESFDDLRKKVPTFAYEKRLSRIETLRLAITYIAFMSDLLEGKEPQDIKLVTNKALGWQVSPGSPCHSDKNMPSSLNQGQN